MSKQALPRPDVCPAWWVGAAWLAAGVALLLLLSAPGGKFEARWLWESARFAAPVAAIGVISLALSLRGAYRRACGRRLAASLRLHYAPEVVVEDVADFSDHSLFALTAPCDCTYADLMEGTIEGASLILFEFGYEVRFRTTEERATFRGGRQTVFLVRGARLPDFRIEPAETAWSDLIAARLWSGSSEQAAREVALDDGTRALVRGPDARAIDRLLSHGICGPAGFMPGWTVECQIGRLLLYREGKRVAAEELGHYLYQIGRVIADLRAALPAPSSGPAPASSETRAAEPAATPARQAGEPPPAGPNTSYRSG